MWETRPIGGGERRVAFELGVAEGEEAERCGGAAATVAVVPGGSVRGAWWDLREVAAAKGRVGVEHRGCYEACRKEKPEQSSEERRKLHRDITECEKRVGALMWMRRELIWCRRTGLFGCLQEGWYCYVSFGYISNLEDF